MKYIFARLLQLPVLLLVVSMLVFVALRLGPGSPVDLATETVRDPAEIARIRHQFGLDQPVYIQYLHYIGGVLRGDFGRSFFGNTPVAPVIAQRLPATLELALLSMFIGTLLGIVIGVAAAIWRNTLLDTCARTFALVGISMPTFWLGLMFISVFAVRFGWLPVGGRYDARTPFRTITGFYVLDSILKGDFRSAWESLKHLFLPALVLGLFVSGFIIRIVRVTTLDVLRQDYIRTARAKGLRERSVVLRHGVRNALLPIATILGLQFGNLLGGAAVTETVFSWPGLGKLMIDAIGSHDFPQVEASIMLLAIIYVVVNLVVDILYAVIDPRIRNG